MMIMADLLENSFATENPDPEKQAEFLTNIRTGLTRMEWLVSALLKMAKLDAGAIVFSPESVAVETLADLALAPLNILLELKNQTVEIAGEMEIVCDKRWTVEALMNILKNASEYSPEGGKIVVESGFNPICAWISVTDSGAGISNADIARLFKKFEGSRSDKGYGVGLPLALKIMRGQGGDIEVSAGSSGTGAVFTLKFYK
jgi:signal transduction histidine kinase